MKKKNIWTFCSLLMPELRKLILIFIFGTEGLEVLNSLAFWTVLALYSQTASRKRLDKPRGEWVNNTQISHTYQNQNRYMRWYFWELPFNVLKCPENRRRSCHLTENTPFFCGLKSLLQVISNPLQRLTRKDESQFKVIIHTASMNLPVYYYLSFFKTLGCL